MVDQGHRIRAPLHASLCAALAVSGCIVVPQTQTVYDPDCRVQTRQVTLQAAYLGGFQACAGEGCAAMLATLGVITAASVVVSGSIALVGNVVYFIERQGRCVRTGVPSAVPSVSPPVSPPSSTAAPPV